MKEQYITALLLLSSISVTLPKEIMVDWTTGKDIESCRNGIISCKTIAFALTDITSNTNLTIGSGNQYINGNITVSTVSNITILGQSTNTTVHCDGSYSDALMFVRVHSFILGNMSFVNCGRRDVSENPAISFLLSTQVHLYHVRFEGSALVFDNTEDVVLNDCQFINNNRLQIEFNGSDQYHSLYRIERCLFVNNSDSMENGGGLSITFRDNIQFKDFVISSCNFSHNLAKYGGALSLRYYNNSANSSIIIKDTDFAYNNAMEGGAVQLFLRSRNLVNNSITFDNVTFSNNYAKIGGGGVSIKSIKTISSQNTITFHSCNWNQNRAVSAGGAITLYPIYFIEDKQDYFIGRHVIPVFNNCNFSSNTIDHYNNEHSQQNGIGIIYSDGISLNISGNVTFEDNVGSSIYISFANIHVLENSNLVFRRNSAINGGGIALMHSSYLTAHENTNIVFDKNEALESGGGIYSSLSNYMDYWHFKHCFLRYFNSSVINLNEWKTKFHFISNTANGLGGDIYAASLKPCCNIYKINDTMDLLTSTPFIFDNHTETGSTVSTDPYNITLVNYIYSSNQNIHVYPGLNKHLPINTTDELGHILYPVLLVTCDSDVNNDSCPFSTKQQFITNYNITFTQSTNDTSEAFSLRLSTLTTREIGITLSIKIDHCPIGYTLNKGECVCNAVLTQPGIVSCNTSTQQIVIQIGYWAGCKNNDTPEILTNKCPPGYCDYTDQTHGLLQIAQSCKELYSSSCSNHRAGKLCGDCIYDYSVLYHSDRFRCFKCENKISGIFLYILSELVPLTILFCIIILFDISLTSGPLSTFVFFAQVLDIFEVTAFGIYISPKPIKIISSSYRFLFGFFNLDFFRLDHLSFCIFKDANTLDILALKYITTLYGFFLICIIFVLMRFSFCQKMVGKCRRTTDGNYTIMNGVVAFVVITYSQCAKVSFEILTRTTLHSSDSNNIPVVLLAGGIGYFSREHLKYAIPAMIMTLYLLFVPLVLIAHPLYFSCKKIIPVSNKSYTQFGSSKLNLYIMPIMDAFQSSYKEDARVFAGILFLYRLIICIAFAFPSDSLLGYSCLELVLILVLSVRTVFHPFRSRFDNTLESLMFTNLAVINGITTFNIAFFSSKSIVSIILVTVQIVLITIPILIVVSVLVCKLVMKLKIVQDKFRKSNIHFNPTTETNQSVFGNERTIPEFDDELPARMIEEDARVKEGKWTMIDVSSDENTSIANWRPRNQSYGCHVQGQSSVTY